MRIAIISLLIAVITFGCVPKKDSKSNSGTKATDGLPGNLRASLGNPNPADGNSFELFVSTKTGTGPELCLNDKPCNEQNDGFRDLSKVSTKGDVDIYKMDDFITPNADGKLTLLAKDNAGTEVEKVVIKFQAKGDANAAGAAAGAGVNPEAELTKGTGGQKGAFEGTFGTKGKFLTNVPADNSPTKAHGLLILLHGSSASSYDRFVNEMAAVSQTHGLIPVSVLAPNGRGWNEGNRSEGVPYLDDLIKNKLYKEYNIDKRKIFFSGQSSGGSFLAADWVPAMANEYKGGAFMQCGMRKPQAPLAPNDVAKASFKLHFEITTGDTIWMDGYQATVDAYKQAGFQVTADNTKGGGHCNFDQAAIIAKYLPTMIGN